MITTVTLIENGAARKIEAERGSLLSDVLMLNHSRIDMPCGGKGICKRCEVSVGGEKYLSCQTKIADGMRVELDRPADYCNIVAGKITASKSQDSIYSRYGLSVDIGTTTVCISLLDSVGQAVTLTRKNPQTSFGADVISRIGKSLDGESGALSDCIRGMLVEMIKELCADKGIEPEAIDAAVITGNTAMLYLLMGHNPETLSHAPFQADRLFGEYIDARTLGLPIPPKARVYLPRCASAFVGGDITTAIIASGMCARNETSMLVDIGTNGEIALWHEDKLICCSTAAGPAFEGAGITHGVYGVNGAIDHVWHENRQIRCSTIGGSEAVGICGSGMIDALAVMLELGIIDETGAFTTAQDFFGLRSGIGITASDVRKIQLAKGSVRAGMETLLQVSVIDKQEITALYIAGGFGSLINLESAVAIGLIPSKLLPCARVIGNAAHTGATMILCDRALVEFSEKLETRSRTVALDANPIFTDNYMEYMMFE